MGEGIITKCRCCMQENQHNAVDEQGNTPAAIQSQVQRKLADLQHQVVQAASKSSEAKQKRRSLLADISSCTRETLLLAPQVTVQCMP